MELTGRSTGALQRLKNQPCDESLEVCDGEETVSVRSTSTTPRGPQRSGRRGFMSPDSSDDFDLHKPSEVRGQPGVSPAPQDEEEEEESEEEDSEEEEEEEEESTAPEGVYDPGDYMNLPVTSDVREMFQYISRYKPQCVDLDHSLKPFIPDFIPAVGDIDAFLKVPRPDGKCDALGLEILDEPSVKQSDPTVMSLWLSEESRQHNDTQVVRVSCVPCPHSDSRMVDSWVQSITELHRSKPVVGGAGAGAPRGRGTAMPDVDSLMQEWPPEVEELLGTVSLPSARLSCSLSQYAELVCGVLDIPLPPTLPHSRVSALHLLFTLYLEFRDSQHFNTHTHTHTHS